MKRLLIATLLSVSCGTASATERNLVCPSTYAASVNGFLLVEKTGLLEVRIVEHEETGARWIFTTGLSTATVTNKQTGTIGFILDSSDKDRWLIVNKSGESKPSKIISMRVLIEINRITGTINISTATEQIDKSTTEEKIHGVCELIDSSKNKF